MNALKVTINVERDGQELPGFPYVRRIVTTEGIGFDYTKASGAGFTTAPTGEIETIQALLLRADRAVIVRLDAQSDAGIELSAGGFIFIVDAIINSGALTNIKVDNTSGADARVDGFAAGN